MKLITRTSPIGVHFGALETRFLQLQGNLGGYWAVRSHTCVSARGLGRQAAAAAQIQSRIRSLRLRGTDAVLALGGDAVSVSLVPVDSANRGHVGEALRETAARLVRDPEGLSYRYLPLTGDENVLDREEYLLLTVGAAEVRRCTNAAESLGLRPVGLEMSAFPTARALQAVHQGEEDPWGFLHLGFTQSLFGVVRGGEIRFLKPLQLDGRSLFERLDSALGSVESMDTLAFSDSESESESEPEIGPGQATVALLHRRAVGRAVEVLHGIQSETESLAQEVRACLRHFSTRNKGARLSGLELTGFGASLPEVEKAVGSALNMPVGLAAPFSALGIRAPEEIRDEEHLWCGALGLAMRGFV